MFREGGHLAEISLSHSEQYIYRTESMVIGPKIKKKISEFLQVS